MDPAVFFSDGERNDEYITINLNSSQSQVMCVELLFSKMCGLKSPEFLNPINYR